MFLLCFFLLHRKLYFFATHRPLIRLIFCRMGVHLTLFSPSEFNEPCISPLQLTVIISLKHSLPSFFLVVNTEFTMKCNTRFFAHPQKSIFQKLFTIRNFLLTLYMTFCKVSLFLVYEVDSEYCHFLILTVGK
jgi:hypothetical protein